MNGPNQESVELFLQEASENLQYLREYSGMLQEPQTKPEDLEKLYIAAHTLAGTSASYGFPQFSEVAREDGAHFSLRHECDAHAGYARPADGIYLRRNFGARIRSAADQFERHRERPATSRAFKQRYSFAFPAPPSARMAAELAESGCAGGRSPSAEAIRLYSYVDRLPEDGEVADEVLEFFVPEAEEHLQAVTECLLALEGNPNADDINRLFRAMHTVKGSAAQVGLHRLSAVAHRVEDLIGQLRDGALQPSAEIVDMCLQSVDVLKKFLHRQWTGDAEMRAAVDPLLARIAELAPEESAEEADPKAQRRLRLKTVSGKLLAPLRRNVAKHGKPLPQAKSVRISLDRLDRMMNAVGELVINRTRMVGRLAEIGEAGRDIEFLEGRCLARFPSFRRSTNSAASVRRWFLAATPRRWIRSGRISSGMPAIMSNDLLEFSDLEMDRYDVNKSK